MVATTTTIQKFQGCPVSGSSWLGSETRNPAYGQDQLRRERDHRRLDRHRDHDAEVADGAVQAVQEGDDDLVDEGEHADLVA